MNMEFNIKQAIINRLRSTNRENIEVVINYMENNGFFTAQCEPHHTYKGGLASHAWQTYQIALRLNKMRSENDLCVQKLDADSIAIASLLHNISSCSNANGMKKQGKSSVNMLIDMGVKLTDDEYNAIYYQNSLRGYIKQEQHTISIMSPLRTIIRNSIQRSVELQCGYDDLPQRKVENWSHYLQNISTICHDKFILETASGWFMNLHDPYDGNIVAEWKEQVIGAMKYDSEELYGINDSNNGAIFVLNNGNKKALFAMHSYHAQGFARYFSPDKAPFIYDDIKIYYDWDEWEEYGYVACKSNDTWKLVKVIQYPKPKYEVVGDGFLTAKEAMKSVGINDSERYRR